MKLKTFVGDKLWYSSEFRQTREVMVSKIGSRWIYFDNGKNRCDFYGHVDDDFGRCYQTKSEYEATCALEDAWKKFKLDISNERLVPVGITIERISKARAWLLGGENETK